MKKIWFNNPELAELLADNGISLGCNEKMEIVVSDEDVDKINEIIKTLAPAAEMDYGFEDFE